MCLLSLNMSAIFHLVSHRFQGFFLILIFHNVSPAPLIFHSKMFYLQIIIYQKAVFFGGGSVFTMFQPSVQL